MKGRTLVIAPHPDDEVLGVGGTMARLADEGAEVFVVVATRGVPPYFEDELVARVRGEAREAHALLGVRETIFLDHPAALLDTIPHLELNASLGRVMQEVAPETVFVPFGGDIHLDHQQVFLSALVASRPTRAGFPPRVYAYETLSETNWNAPYLSPSFLPTVYVDVSRTLDRKLEAMRIFGSQLRPAPHERSLEALRALATLRGSTVGVAAAEAFVLVRQLI